MQFVLLTHEREVPKPSNTGQLLLVAEGVDARQVVWARKSPDHRLLADIAERRALLIYPLSGAEGFSVTCLEEKEHGDSRNRMSSLLPANPLIVLIDATWQQAQKMYNQSPYLHAVPRLELRRERPSMFWLRRNQKAVGLCTVECAIEVFRLAGERLKADVLEAEFLAFLSMPRG